MVSEIVINRTDHTRC